MQEILIANIRTDASVQSREKINLEYVQELVDQLKAGKRLPPVDVYRDGEEIWMADGWHRLLGHQEANKKTIRAEVHKGGRKEARWHSVASNQSHGLRRTNEDKRRCVKMALEDHPEMSDQAIAEHVGVSDRHVSGIRSELTRLGKVSPVTTRVGVDGVARKIPPPPPPNQRVTQPPPPGNRVLPPPPAPRIPPPPTVPKKAEVLGEDGKPIPDHLHPLWNRAPELQEILSDLSRIKGMLTRAQDNDDPLFRDVNYNSALAALATLYGDIKATKPYALCPHCHGKIVDNCRACNKRGLISEFRYNMVPRELR